MDNKLDAVQESIKLALDAADAATDVTSEYNKVRKEHAILEGKVKQIHKYTTVVFLSSIFSGLIVVAVSAFLFMQGSNKLTSMTETSREALVVFAENVDGVNSSLKNLNEAIKKQGDLLAVNQKLVLTLEKIEKRIETGNDNTIGELRVISQTLVDELNKNSKVYADNNNKMNATLKNITRSNTTKISKVIKDISNQAIYKQIVANQAVQAQQISKLVKQNNGLLGKIADKTSRIKYP
ncbi:hypothetical protein OAD33_06510 [Alphaproteobacteria bacterium]|jgi:hypothetical protein|nr:hypothetical protein [Alphaproteobacteria bacterium]MDB9870707.1 hypothetical protein [Alphaproteobacteria bacterium]